MSEHSKYFSPSAANTWLNCHGSAVLNADLENVGNPDSERGTMLHDFSAKNYPIPEVDIPFDTLKKDDAKDVRAALTMAWDLEASLTEPVVLIESPGVVFGLPEVFGTIDLIMYSELDEHLIIADYKFGHGGVPAETPQLKIYAQAARSALPETAKVTTVTLAIIQPKQSSKPVLLTMTWKELLEWRGAVLVPAVKSIQDMLAGAIPPSFNPGEKQCQWCRTGKSGKCPAMNQEVESLLSDMGGQTPSRPEKTLSEKLKQVPVVRLWCEAVEREASEALNKGISVEGFKLVLGRSNRAWADPEKAGKWLARQGLKEKERYKWTLIGIPAAEEFVAKMELTEKQREAFYKLIIKPEGKPTVAPATDKRPAIIINQTPDVLDNEQDELDEL